MNRKQKLQKLKEVRKQLAILEKQVKERRKSKLKETPYDRTQRRENLQVLRNMIQRASVKKPGSWEEVMERAPVENIKNYKPLADAMARLVSETEEGIIELLTHSGIPTEDFEYSEQEFLNDKYTYGGEIGVAYNRTLQDIQMDYYAPDFTSGYFLFDTQGFEYPRYIVPIPDSAVNAGIEAYEDYEDELGADDY